MLSMKIFNIADLDVSKFTYSEPKVNAMGGQSVYITANSDGDKIIVQTPKCGIPFGLNAFDPPQGGEKNTVLICHFVETVLQCKIFYNLCKHLMTITLKLLRKIVSHGSKSTWKNLLLMSCTGPHLKHKKTMHQ